MNELYDMRAGYSEGYCSKCHQPLGIDGVCYACAVNELEPIDTRTLCWSCGWPMEWTGEERELELEGGEIVVYEPVYECVNPDCNEDEGE